MKKLLILILSCTFITGMLAACGSSSASGDDDKEVTIGSKNYTEQFLLSKITALYLEDNGFKVKEKSNLGSSALRKALLNKQVDFTWDYTGTGLVNYLKKEPISDPQKSFETVKKIDKKKNDINWINMSGVNNTYAIAMQQKKADELGIESLSDLAEYINKNPNKIQLATDTETANRSDGIKGLEKSYEFEFGSENMKLMKDGLQYGAIEKGEVNAVKVNTTDPQIKDQNLVVLKDDKSFFPSYRAAVSIHQDVLDKYPKLKDLTADLANKLDAEIIVKLSYQVDIKGKQVKNVAKKWLKDNDMLGD
ncbi:hypothetical protein GCM10008983_07650 [Lentibacillus halophilus]|uniref:ABC-type glycine betaine transport system substrate-binding domain-containing protein n=1 Tax=Lentibacillus halophilus TaxID=295065 RepID=A0ABP3IYT6_9BACI